MVLSSILTLAGLGFVAAALLAVASKVFHVDEDPRVGAVMDVLPGANCGGCGYAGCEGYAIAVVNVPSVGANLCVAGGAELSQAVGELTGKAVADSEPLVSFRRCDKIAGNVQKRYTYHGMSSCASAATLGQGSDACPHSCLGLGDCVLSCPFDALYLENDLVTVRKNLCTGCGKCVQACPRGILEIIPKRARVTITCSTKDKLKAVMDVCGVGCIQCGKCIKSCPAGAISSQDSRMVIDQEKCLAYGADCHESCATACPRMILHSNVPKICQCDKEEKAKVDKAESEVKAEAKKEAKAETKVDASATAQAQTDDKPEVKPEVKADVKIEAKNDKAQEQETAE